jgi:acyl carrier protein
LPDVAAATVIMREDEPGDRRLVAYVTLDTKDYDEGEVIAGLRRDLQLRVPDYMVPAAFVVLDEFPLTANGKLDRRALPIPGFTSLRAEYVAPATETEIALAQMWARLLKLDADAISADANLFELGGHSLLLIRLITEIRNTFAVELTIREVMDHPQLHVLAQRILETRLKQALTAGPEYEIGADEMEITI